MKSLQKKLWMLFQSLRRQEPNWFLCQLLPHKENQHGGDGLLRIRQEDWQTEFSLVVAQDKGPRLAKVAI
jgi:hypothetical protein